MANSNNFKLAEEWFTKARADIDFAKIGIRETEHYGQVCFLCQQAAEKYLKGLLVAHGLKPPKIHSVATLAAKCSKFTKELGTVLAKCKLLDRYYIPTRYPVATGLIFKKEDALGALSILTEIIEVVEKVYTESRK
jgi:HEPN domain-containing protein